MTLKPNSHGGKRTPGSGKRLGAPTKRGVRKVGTSLNVTPEILEFFTTLPNRSEWAEDMVRETEAFQLFVRKLQERRK